MYATAFAGDDKPTGRWSSRKVHWQESRNIVPTSLSAVSTSSIMFCVCMFQLVVLEQVVDVTSASAKKMEDHLSS
jgi:hypothetical protein